MSDCELLLTAADRLAGRFRALPQSRLQGGAAAVGLALARELSARAQAVESPGAEVRVMPDEGGFVVGDQIAVAAHDLAAALASHPDGPGIAPGIVEEAVRSLEAAAKDCGL